MRRPFDGLVVSKDGEPPGGTEQWHALSNFGIYSDTTAGTGTSGDQSGETTQVQKAIPQSALGDFRLDATLDDLVTAGTFVRAEARQVLGRNCQVYRTGQPLESFGTAAATDSDYTDACIDEAGLMLEEVSVQGGKLAERIIATQVTTQPTITDSTFAITGTPMPLASGGTELNQIDATAVPVPGYFVLDAPPTGYQLQGRYVLRHAANTTADETGATTTTVAGQAPTIVDSYVDVYVAGRARSSSHRGRRRASPTRRPRAASPATSGRSGRPRRWPASPAARSWPIRPTLRAGTCTWPAPSHWRRCSRWPSPFTHDLLGV